ncbi:MAG: NAD(P)-dependent oxidoreductase [Pseudomonadota bacterium]|nr:NAD(P)-dependent oxidoreductase [Pseudomonadota bacterium]
MKILVTGGTGFLGRHLVWRAARQGANIVFTGRNPKAAAEVIQYAGVPVHWLTLEHGQPESQAQLCHAAAGAHAVVHCAALSSPWGKREDFERANIASTAEVIAACEKNGVARLIHISTPSLYFGFADRLAIPEDAALPAPANEYVRTKTQAETLVRQALARGALAQAVILRPRGLFGPWDQTVVPRLLRVMQQGRVPLMRTGQQQLDLTYIDNAVDAIWLAATQPLPQACNTYNVSNNEPHTLLYLLQLMADAFALPLRTRRVPWPVISMAARMLELAAHARGGVEPLFTRYSAGVLAFSQTLDVTALQNDLGWQPGVGIHEGIRRHAQWWRAHTAGASR